jgi:hypothetical protein|tara:strand:- start:12577 stop:13218 length:642 start_codon:yes stop_codon:yes gene_type:complete
MARPSKIISKEDIQRAQLNTRSNMAAARYLHISYNHYKKYAKTYKNEEGITLLEAHKNQAGEGIPKFAISGIDNIPLMDVLEGRVPIEHFDSRKIKARLLSEGMLVEVCASCGFSERRVTDQKIPVILNFKDGNKKNWHLDNLEFLCYNHSFLYAASPIDEKQAEAMEDYVKTVDDQPDWELDEHHIEHLKELGLYEREEDKPRPGDEYISRL